MFDTGFWELILIGIIGLIVLGPERLPVAIRTVGSWIKSVRDFSDKVKSDLNEELKINELEGYSKKDSPINLQKLSLEISDSLKDIQETSVSVPDIFKEQDIIIDIKEAELNSSINENIDNFLNDTANKSSNKP
ncbi:MAG: twin-arginine translocase subunit TatB [Alteromonadaceae bacterium TMED7]|nr:MAG: twin-arginine translocase subunit TatB [Alteromonadaceae bacterium TMED7]|tara:strand:- start:15332 stop:15733 length:402 start_codon:yes stop_codon:yes gene_type:complete